MTDVSEILETNCRSVEEVAYTMRQLRDHLNDQGRESMTPFLNAYLKITEEVIREKQKGSFTEPEKLEKLDIRFAELYFNAVKHYLEDGEKKQPWKTYFDYIERSDSKPVLELALGINAHINSDLTQTLHEQNYNNTEDFNKINKILRKSLYPVLKNTAVKRGDIETLGFIGFPPAAFAGLNRITSWRSHAMRNSGSEAFEVQKIRELTEENAQEMIELRHGTGPVQILRKPIQMLQTQIEI